MADESESLWPSGSNKELLYAMGNYYQSLLKDYGTKLRADKQIRIQKLKNNIIELLELINGNADGTIHDTSFDLPQAYSLWKKSQNDNNNNQNLGSSISSSSFNSFNSYNTQSSHMSLSSSSSSSNISSLSASRSKRSCTVLVTKSVVNTVDQTDKYLIFDKFLLKQQIDNKIRINKLSAKYLVFLGITLNKYNNIYTNQNAKNIINSLDDVPSLKAILYYIRYLYKYRNMFFQKAKHRPIIKKNASICLTSISNTINQTRRYKHHRVQSAQLPTNINRLKSRVPSPPLRSPPPPIMPSIFDKSKEIMQINKRLNLNAPISNSNGLFTADDDENENDSDNESDDDMDDMDDMDGGHKDVIVILNKPALPSKSVLVVTLNVKKKYARSLPPIPIKKEIKSKQSIAHHQRSQSVLVQGSRGGDALMEELKLRIMKKQKKRNSVVIEENNDDDDVDNDNDDVKDETNDHDNDSDSDNDENISEDDILDVIEKDDDDCNLNDIQYVD